jgi:hypothetical protein
MAIFINTKLILLVKFGFTHESLEFLGIAGNCRYLYVAALVDVGCGEQFGLFGGLGGG